MRSVRGMRGVIALAAPAVLVAVLGVGCGGEQVSGQELPESPEPVATVITDGILPGDRRAPDGLTVTTKAFRPPLGRAKIPMPVRPPPTVPVRTPSTLTGIPGS